ncbi:MAG: cren protein [Thermoprotei archaeon]|nr:MAG: cren protein [Thermoprotei archaeon]RLE90289.1 MAG: cren protein [Thermoprotei archaeon]RLI82403.1 MAG: cren protein [Archaeoglobales archaeon]
MEVEGLDSLARFAASMSSMGYPIYIMSFKGRDGSYIYGLLAVLKDYYKMYGIPVFYYYRNKSELKGKYLLINLTSKEQVRVEDGIRPGWIHIPIIKLKRSPEFIDL